MPSLNEQTTESVPAEATAPKIWRSLSELENTPEFRKALAKEFPDQKPESIDEPTRRRFLQLMGASVALMAASGCGWKEEKIAPFASAQQAEIIPGVPRYFTTAMEVSGNAIGLLVKSYDGRPIKIEGNPQHPSTGDISREPGTQPGAEYGAADTYALGSILEMYDPDRSKSVSKRETAGHKPATFADLQAVIAKIIADNKGKGASLRFLSERSSSPSLLALRAKVKGVFPQSEWIEYEPISDDNVREGTKQALGAPHRPHFSLEKTDRIVSFDADLFGCHPAAIVHARDWGAKQAVALKRADFSGQEIKRRGITPGMVRMYAVESNHSTSGAMADHRLPIRSEQVLPFMLALAGKLKAHPKLSGAAGLAGLPTFEIKDFLREAKVEALLNALADDLAENVGKSVIAVGSRQPAAAHALAVHLNAVLGNGGKTVNYTAEPDAERKSNAAGIKTLTAEMTAGKVETLVILGGNPVYNAPVDLAFAAALAKVPTSIHHSLYLDETGLQSTWHLPKAHFLEAWSDAHSYDGYVSVVQPLIDAPLYKDARSTLEFVSLLAEEKPRLGLEIVQETFKTISIDGAETAWREALHTGVLRGNKWGKVAGAPKGTFELPKIEPRAMQTTVKPGEFEIVFAQDSKIYDGRFANNGWLQEVPDFITKVTWDNAALISPATASQLGLGVGTSVYGTSGKAPVVQLKTAAGSIDVALYPLPGHADGSITINLGYGRTAAGHVGGHDGLSITSPGANAYKIRGSEAMDFAVGCSVVSQDKSYTLAATQEHFLIDATGKKGAADRMSELVKEATLKKYEAEPKFAQHVHGPPLQSLWKEFTYEGNRWGMAIDLTNCYGCNACMVACVAENNIPVVGKDQVANGREMHWIRTDRYFTGTPEEPKVASQPVPCMQCENAPCEQVCPVAATVHSKDGLNDMVYNRCIGTRYCSNNCPYKVRRFNWFDFHQEKWFAKDKTKKDADNATKWLGMNPDVTVRSRGVMEKCTYCVQRIKAATIPAKNAGRVVKETGRVTVEDGEIITACQQACPSRAIVFGDLNDPKSAVWRLHGDDRSYGLLAELNSKPRTAYLAKIRNPNPVLEPEKTSDAKHGGHGHDAKKGAHEHAH